MQIFVACQLKYIFKYLYKHYLYIFNHQNIRLYVNYIYFYIITIISIYPVDIIDTII